MTERMVGLRRIEPWPTLQLGTLKFFYWSRCHFPRPVRALTSRIVARNSQISQRLPQNLRGGGGSNGPSVMRPAGRRFVDDDQHHDPWIFGRGATQERTDVLVG